MKKVMTGAAKFINRELSWLEFNFRVLERAANPEVPLLERVKFLAISASNLNEFFMVRVGGLRILADSGTISADPTGMSPAEQLEAISIRTHEMIDKQYRLYHEELEQLLSAAGIRRLDASSLTDSQARHMEDIFESELFPVLSPVAVEQDAGFPLFASHLLHLGVRLAPAKEGAPPRFAVIPIGRNVPRFVTVPAESGYDFVLLEDVLRTFLPRFFPGESVQECMPFRLIRDADVAVRDELAADYKAEMQAALDARKRGDCVHLEVEDQASETFLSFLKKSLDVRERDICRVRSPLDLSALSFLPRIAGCPELKDKPWLPQSLYEVKKADTVFEVLSQRDILLYHPFDAYEPVVRMIDEAADDPDVLSIKQILYRTSRNSLIVAALARAAEKGKSVTAVLELKARFDEARNMEWATELEDAGVQVVYGVKGLKTHAKACMVVRREPRGVVRYLHFGTGNYNEITAQQYCDVSYMTCNEDLGSDTASFFNSITGYSQPVRFNKLCAAPTGLREALVELIMGEADRARQKQKASITAKMNSLTDPMMIEALYAASQAGVKIRLNVRGTCCLRPGVSGLSSNIIVTSILDRYLEHARIFRFNHGGDQKLFISSADWMTRNLDKRIELMIPVEDPACRKRLNEILEAAFKDTANAWTLLPDGKYVKEEAKARRHGRGSQETLYLMAVERARSDSRFRKTRFEPHRPMPGPT